MLTKELKKFKKKIKNTYPNITATLKDDCILLEGTLKEYLDIVTIGNIAAKCKFYNVINNIKLEGFIEPKMRTIGINDNKYDNMKVDVLVIGGGIVGCSILRELSKYNLNSVLVEKEEDLAMQASSRNDGCIHVGIDISYKTKKLQYLKRSVPIYKDLAKDLGVDYNEMGQLLAFDSNLYLLFYPILKKRIRQNDIKKVRLVNRKELFEIEPNINKKAKFGILFETGACICPYNMTIALAENAVMNNAKVLLSTAVVGMDVKENKIISVKTTRGVIYPKVVINAAGTFSDVVADMAKDKFFSIHPRKGTNLILDKLSKTYLMRKSSTLFGGLESNKKMHTKGGGIVPTIDGNILVGPSAIETPYRENFETDLETINAIINKHKHSAPSLSKKDIITYFTGVRAATYKEDFVIEKGKWTKNIVHAAGIQSPGLTAAPAIAEDIAKYTKEILEENGMKVEDNKNFNPIRKAKPILNKLSLEQRNELIKKNPDYGQIICRCEEISKGEIIDAIHSIIPVFTVDGIKRRVRAGMGRCQGGFCQPSVVSLIAQEQNININDVCKKGDGKIILCDTKELREE